MHKSPFLTTGLKAVKAAETIIVEYFQNPDLAISQKEDGSPVTIADQRAEKTIRSVISAAFPDHGFIGEEYGDTQTKSEYTWVIDPIDGTKNYSRGIPHFATELALFKGEELILGISNAPMLNKCLTAQKGHGAFINGDTQIHVSTISDLKKAYISVGSIRYFDSRGKLETLSQLNKDISGLKGFGDTWSYHFLAEGKLDAILEAKTNLWDFAATAAIVMEAGGNVTDFNGDPISFSTENLIASNGALHDTLVARFKMT